MDCAEFNQVLPEIIDEQIRDFRGEGRIGEIHGQQNEYEKHLNSCSECSELVSDLKTISTQAHELHGEEEPSLKVWERIELALRHEGIIHEALQPEIVFSQPSRRWSIANWRIPRFAPIAAAALIALGMLGYQRLSAPQQAGDRIAVTQAPVATQVASVKSKAFRGKNAMKSDQEFLALVSSRRPAMRAKYEADLQRVNAYIQDAENSVQTDPNDQVAQQYLMDAYQQKAVMYQLALDRSLP